MSKIILVLPRAALGLVPEKGYHSTAYNNYKQAYLFIVIKIDICV